MNLIFLCRIAKRAQENGKNTDSDTSRFVDCKEVSLALKHSKKKMTRLTRSIGMVGLIKLLFISWQEANSILQLKLSAHCQTTDSPKSDKIKSCKLAHVELVITAISVSFLSAQTTSWFYKLYATRIILHHLTTNVKLKLKQLKELQQQSQTILEFWSIPTFDQLNWKQPR